MLIREGRKDDLPQVLDLIKELAQFERAPLEVTNTVALMEQDGFGDAPAYGLFVAAEDSLIVGISIYYYRYSTWKGKRLYLEDIVVSEARRGQGIGSKLFDRTMEKAASEDCSGMVWQVLEWNKKALDFYEKYGAKLDDEWTNCSLERDQINNLLKS